MKLTIQKATTSKLIQFFVLDSSQTDGRGLTGLVYNTGSLTAYYYREGVAAPATSISLVTMTVGTWASGGFKEIDSTNMPGWYQLGVPDAALADSAESVIIMLKGAANMAPVEIEIQLGMYFDDDGTATFDPTTDSLQAIRDAIAASAPVGYHPDSSSVITVGNEDSGTYADCAVDNGTRWTIGDEDAGILQATIDVTCEFNMGSNRIATGVSINGYYNRSGGGAYVVEIYAYNYTTTSWDKISSASVNEEMRDRANDKDYAFVLASEHTDPVTTPGEVKIRFQSTRDTTAGSDVLYLDHVHVSGIAAGATSPEVMASAVWQHIILSAATENSAGYYLRTLRTLVTTVATGDSTTSFTLTDGLAVNDAYNGMLIVVEDITDDHYEVRRIVDYTSGLVVTLDRALGFTPVSGDEIYIMATGYADVNTVAVSGSSDAADRLEASAETIVTGAAATGTLSTTQMTTDLTEATDDHYNGRILIWTSGGLKDQATDITDYTGSSKMMTFLTVTEAPSNGDTFVVV